MCFRENISTFSLSPTTTRPCRTNTLHGVMTHQRHDESRESRKAAFAAAALVMVTRFPSDLCHVVTLSLVLPQSISLGCLRRKCEWQFCKEKFPETESAQRKSGCQRHISPVLRRLSTAMVLPFFSLWASTTPMFTALWPDQAVMRSERSIFCSATTRHLQKILLPNRAPPSLSLSTACNSRYLTQISAREI